VSTYQAHLAQQKKGDTMSTLQKVTVEFYVDQLEAQKIENQVRSGR
jgi:hypothetical protein